MKIILLGHGAETKNGFELKNPDKNKRISIRSFTKADTYTFDETMIAYINKIFAGESVEQITYENMSTIIGGQIADRELLPLEDLQPKFETKCNLNSYERTEDSKYVCFSDKDKQIMLVTTKRCIPLSEILEDLMKCFPNETYEIYWAACRTYAE